MSPLVVVVVLNWNGWTDTLSCLHSVEAIDYPNLRVLLVDNGSTDDSVQRLRGCVPGLELIESGENLGFGGGCNVGIRRALELGAHYVWLVNSDARVAADTLQKMVELAQDRPRLGAVGAVVFEMDRVEEVQLWGGGRVNLHLGRSRHCKAAQPLDFVSGACMLLRATALQEVGLFDEQSYFMYWEDTDLCLRLRRRGWELGVATGASVWHRESSSLGRNSPRLAYYNTCSGVRFLRRHAPWPGLSIFLMMGLRLARCLWGMDRSRFVAVLQGYLRA